MDFEEFLPKEESCEGSENEQKPSEHISQSQFYDVITSRKPDWQSIIYDLISSEQLDPWDIDIVVLTRGYFEKIAELEEQDFYISSKVLLAAALLLRIKSEFLLNKHIRSIDDILFGRKDESEFKVEKIHVDEDELPMLIPKTPMPRLRRVTLTELMDALNHAINTESRRIKREVAIRRAKKLSEVDFPTFNKIDLKDRVRQFYAKILTSLKKTSKNTREKHLNKVGYTNLSGSAREEKVSCFLPLLHLSNTKKLWLEQETHLDEIWIYLYEYFDKNRDNFLESLSIEDSGDSFADVSPELIEDEITRNIKQAETEFEKNSENINEEIIKNKKISEEEEKEQIRREIIKEIAEEEKELSREEKIDESSGFSSE